MTLGEYIYACALCEGFRVLKRVFKGFRVLKRVLKGVQSLKEGFQRGLGS